MLDLGRSVAHQRAAQGELVVRCAQGDHELGGTGGHQGAGLVEDRGDDVVRLHQRTEGAGELVQLFQVGVALARDHRAAVGQVGGAGDGDEKDHAPGVGPDEGHGHQAAGRAHGHAGPALDADAAQRRASPTRVYGGHEHQQEAEVDDVDEGDGQQGHRPAVGAGGGVTPDGLVVGQDAQGHAGQVEEPVGEGLDGGQAALGAGGQVAARDGQQRRARGQEDHPDQCRDLRQGDGQAGLAVTDGDRLSEGRPDAQRHHDPQLGAVATGRLEPVQLGDIEQGGPGGQQAGQHQGAYHRKLTRAPLGLGCSFSLRAQRPRPGDGRAHPRTRQAPTSNSRQC